MYMGRIACQKYAPFAIVPGRPYTDRHNVWSLQRARMVACIGPRRLAFTEAFPRLTPRYLLFA
ncbi:MAG: hypothetical protein QOF67_1720 [Mycobacterium sp.]|jgi:hypothetical protein|nr:hypothetical protein [Mycobacterium sp.]